MIQPGTVVPRSQLCVGVDPALRAVLAAMAEGKVVVIDYFASRGCSVVVGDLTCELRSTPPTRGFTELAAVEGVRLFVEIRLLRVLRDAGASLRMGGPPFARHLAVELEAPERWIAFLEEPGILSGKQRLGLPFGTGIGNVPADPGRDGRLDRRARLAGRLVAAPARVRRAAFAAEAAPVLPGEWTAQQIVLHLVAVEEQVFQQRLLDLRAAESPEWAWVEPGPAEPQPGETLAASVVRFAGMRLATLDWVAGLDEAGWVRAGRHATLGVLDVQGILALAADHDAEHIATLAKLGRPAPR